MNSSYKSFLSKALWVALALAFLRCVISWGEITTSLTAYDIYGYASEVVTVSIIAMTLYEKWIWRWNPWEKVPALKKVYTGTLQSTHDNQERSATIKIKQTLLSVHITLISEESKSESLVASIHDNNGDTELVYTYLNTPKAAFRHRSEIQYGTARICIDNPNELTGQYYTDRGTKGDMTFAADKSGERKKSRV